MAPPNKPMHPTAGTRHVIKLNLLGGRVRYCVYSQAVFCFCIHSGSNGLPVLSTP